MALSAAADRAEDVYPEISLYLLQNWLCGENRSGLTDYNNVTQQFKTGQG